MPKNESHSHFLSNDQSNNRTTTATKQLTRTPKWKEKNDQVQGKKIQCKSSTTDTRQEIKRTDTSFTEKCNAMLEENASLEKIPHCLRNK